MRHNEPSDDLGPLPIVDENAQLQWESFEALKRALPSQQFLFRDERVDDYGIDATLELIAGGQATNFRSQIQLKATDDEYINQDGSISFSIAVTNLNYLTNGTCPLYVLYIRPRRELRFAWAMDEMTRIALATPQWQEQQTVTLHFRNHLTGSVILQIYERILQDGRNRQRTFDVSPASQPLFGSLHNLEGKERTTFFGHEHDIQAIADLLTQNRLVTLTGAGGVGKTRLAIRVGYAILNAEDNFHLQDGVWLVEFASLTDPSLVAQRIGQVFGLAEEAGRDILTKVKTYLHGKSLLLIIDNCEHLLPSCATLVNDLLESCGNLRILATSRQKLDVYGEEIWRVRSLVVPESEEERGRQSPQTYEAVQLFLSRAISTDHRFEFSDSNRAGISRICCRLDGIPLAIELAATRVRTLSVVEIEERLIDRFQLLVGGSHTQLERHQTLKATIDWSYALLSEKEKILLQRLSVFGGGWSLNATEVVCGGDKIKAAVTPNGTLDFEILELLTGLIDKSLVIPDGSSARTRYRMLETIRIYAQEKLLESGETDYIKTRHRDYYLELAEATETKLFGPEQAHWLERLETEHDNLRLALDFCLKETEGVEAGLRLGSALEPFWDVHGHFREGRTHLEAALARAVGPEPSQARTRALLGTAHLAMRQGDYAASRTLSQEGLSLYRELGDKRGIASALGKLGGIAHDQGNYADACSLYEESLATRRELGDKRGIASVLSNLGGIALNQSNYDEARSLYEESLALRKELGDKRGIASVLGHLGVAAQNQANLVDARSLHKESLVLRKELGDKAGVAYTLGNLGWIAQEQGNYAEARTLYEESLTIRTELGDKWGVASALGNLGATALNQGDHADARSLLEKSLAIFRELGDKWGVAHALGYLGVIALDQGNYAEARSLLEESLALRKELEDKHGTADSLDTFASLACNQQQAVRATHLWGAATAAREAITAPRLSRERDRYEREATHVRATLGEAAFDTAFADGRAMTLEQAIEYALSRAYSHKQPDPELRSIAARFRRGLERLTQDWEQIEEHDDLPYTSIAAFPVFQHFPWSCCDKTTMLLVRYLHEQGFTDAHVVNGALKRDMTENHEWVEVGELIIDLTADQFTELDPVPAPVMVTTDRTWHDRYGHLTYFQYTPGWSEWDDFDHEHRELLDQFYQVVVSLIPTDGSGSEVSPEP